MHTRFLHILLGSLLVWLVTNHQAQAQIRPINANMVFTPPYTLSLSDYTSATSQKLRINLQLNDLTSPPRLVKLRFTIQGAGVTIRTQESFLQSNQVQAITLTAGIPLQLSGLNEALRQYFNPANLEVLGIDRNQFLRSKRLPSGIYRWQLEVLDFQRMVPLNNVQTSAQTIWMVLNQPPLVNIPQNNQKLRATDYGTQNVIFQWLNRSASSPNSAFSIQYQVFLYELFEPQGPIGDPMSAPRTLLYSNPTPLTNPTLIYNNTFPALTPGKRYIFQVQAQDVLGRDLFENNGFSQIVVFQYGDECVAPAQLKASVLNTQSVKLIWQGSSFHTGYRIRYRAMNGNDPWAEVTSQFTDYIVDGLQPDTEYEFEIGSVCGTLQGQKWSRSTAKTNAPNNEDFVCGVPAGTYDLTNETPLEILNEKEEFLAGGYRVKVRRAQGSNGQFTGVGVASIPVGRFKVKFKVSFKDIFINADKRMLQGNIQVVRNKWKAMALAEEKEVDEWKITEDGKVQILKDGRWTTFTPTGGADYLLVDAKTQKKLFVDRNGKPDIPLEDRDYSKYTPEQIIEEIKKLKEEADDAIADGRWGDALKLLDKAAELAERIPGAAKELKEALEKLFEELGSLIEEALGVLKATSKKRKEQLNAKNKFDFDSYSKLRKEVLKEDKDKNLIINSNSQVPTKQEVVKNSVNPSLFPTVSHAKMSGTDKAKELEERVQEDKALKIEIELERIRYDQLITYLENPSKFGDLLRKVKKSVERLGVSILDDVLNNNVDGVKEKIQKEVKKIVDDLVREFYDKQQKQK